MFSPYFLTDPRDGSLYIFTGSGDGGLKKFPYTIAELVSASPSKSADGFLYTGDKRDQWLAIDNRSGKKLDTLNAETLHSKIEIADENVVFIGRTEYTIVSGLFLFAFLEFSATCKTKLILFKGFIIVLNFKLLRNNFDGLGCFLFCLFKS